MLIHKCDKCRKVIRDENKKVNVVIGFWGANVLLCDVCGKPITSFLKKNRLISEKKTKIKKA